jgi:four helix bundle protein
MAGTHEDLVIWQRSLEVIFLIYELSAQLPDGERFGLVSQMRRAAVSVPSNIAEGYCRFSQKDFRRFLGIALGSAAELHTQLIVTERIYNLDTSKLRNEVIEISKMTRAFIKKLS